MGSHSQGAHLVPPPTLSPESGFFRAPPPSEWVGANTPRSLRICESEQRYDLFVCVFLQLRLLRVLIEPNRWIRGVINPELWRK